MSIALKHSMIKKIRSRSGMVLLVIGGIASGKTTACKLLKKYGFMIFDSDKEVHKLLMPDSEIFGKLSLLFPESIINDGIDREILSNIVFSDHYKLQKLESLIHPLVRERRHRLIEQVLKTDCRSIACEVPMLLEGKAPLKRSSKEVILLIKSNLSLMRTRSLLRKSMTNDKFEAIIERQISDDEREKEADLVLSNFGSILSIRKRLRRLIIGRFKKGSFRYGNHGLKRQRWT